MRFLAAIPLLVPLSFVGSLDSAREPLVAHTVSSPRDGLGDALEVLHTWDRRRALAWAEVDASALRALYVRGSGAGYADVRLLRAYAARGLVVRRIVTQLFAVKVLRSDRSVVRLRVFDRVAGGEVVQDGHSVALRSSRPVTRQIEFRLVSGSWRVSGISDSGRAPRAAQR